MSAKTRQRLHGSRSFSYDESTPHESYELSPQKKRKRLRTGRKRKSESDAPNLRSKSMRRTRTHETSSGDTSTVSALRQMFDSAANRNRRPKRKSKHSHSKSMSKQELHTVTSTPETTSSSTNTPVSIRSLTPRVAIPSRASSPRKSTTKSTTKTSQSTCTRNESGISSQTQSQSDSPFISKIDVMLEMYYTTLHRSDYNHRFKRYCSDHQIDDDIIESELIQSDQMDPSMKTLSFKLMDNDICTKQQTFDILRYSANFVPIMSSDSIYKSWYIFTAFPSLNSLRWHLNFLSDIE